MGNTIKGFINTTFLVDLKILIVEIGSRTRIKLVDQNVEILSLIPRWEISVFLLAP